MQQMRPLLRNGTCILISKGEPRSVVVWNTTVAKARSASVNGTLRTRTGRTFATMPQSNNQTSPRLGGTFLLMKHCCQHVACNSNCVIAKRPGIPRRQVVHYLSQELLLLLDWQRLELGKQFCRSSAHRERILHQINRRKTGVPYASSPGTWAKLYVLIFQRRTIHRDHNPVTMHEL